jgi:hypothetical protein
MTSNEPENIPNPTVADLLEGAINSWAKRTGQTRPDPTPRCRYCGDPIHRWLTGWVTDKPFGEGMALCAAARDAGIGKLHEPTAEARP